MKKVVVIGDVIEDIIVISNGERKANTDNPSTIQSTPGGSGANFAVWLASLGVETELIARISSKDKERLESYFRSVNVTPSLQTDQDLETGKIVVLVEGNQRTFFTDRAANQKLEPPELSSCDLLYLSGYTVLSLGKDQTQALLSEAKREGALVAVDPGSASFIEGFGVTNFLEAIQGVDMVFPNLEEGQLLTCQMSPESISRELCESFPLVALTIGEQGVALCARQTDEIIDGELIAAPHYFQLSAKAVRVIDPTGAGDAFAAGFIQAFLQRGDLLQAAKQGVELGSLAIQQPGGRPSKIAKS